MGIFKSIRKKFCKSEVNCDSESLRLQRNVRNWTAFMAVCAFLAAGFTFWYAITTKNILKQARDDSKLEYRPYVSLDTLATELIYDSSIPIKVREYRYTLRYRLINRGKSPANNLKLAFGLNTKKDTSDISINNFIKKANEAAVFSMLHGDFSVDKKKEFTLSIEEKTDGSLNCVLKYGDRNLKVNVDSLNTAVFYFEVACTYSDLETDYRYFTYYILGLKFNANKPNAETYSEFCRVE